MTDVAAAKKLLDDKLSKLEQRRDDMVAALEAPLSPDLPEQATELEDDDPLHGQIAVLNDEIASVTAALRRIDEGTYGECVNCGEDISQKRLEVQPEATLCIDCASRR